jgi:PhnB protein
MQRITPYLFYEDVEAALEFLAGAFGFRETLRYQGAQGYVTHAEMLIGDATIMLGDPGEDYQSPGRSGAPCSAIHVTVDDVQATYERAMAAGAEIAEPPADQPYGGRRFGATDPEGQAWWFSQPIGGVAANHWSAPPASSTDAATTRTGGDDHQ